MGITRETNMYLGVGQAGNNLVNELLGRDPRFVGFFYNTSYSDMQLLSNARVGDNVFVPNNTSGTGKDRLKSKELIKKNSPVLIDMLRRNVMTDVYNIVFSMDGGTGGGSGATLAAVIKQMIPQVIINIVMVKPAFATASIVSLSNTLECLSEVLKLKDMGIVNSITILDNDKRDDVLAINREWAEDENMSFNLDAPSPYGVIDATDATKTRDAAGYKVAYRLEDGLVSNVKTAIELAKNKSIYYTPDDDVVDYLAISIKPNGYDLGSIVQNFNILETHYSGFNTMSNFVLASGMSIPVMLKEFLDNELEAKMVERENIRNAKLNNKIVVDKEKLNKTHSQATPQQVTESRSSVTSIEDINKMVNSDVFSIFD